MNKMQWKLPRVNKNITNNAFLRQNGITSQQKNISDVLYIK